MVSDMNYRQGARITTATIGRETGLSQKTVRKHMAEEKLDIANLTSVMKYIATAKLMGYISAKKP